MEKPQLTNHPASATTRRAYTPEEYRHLLNAVLTVVFTLDSNGHIVYINAVCQEILGYKPEEMIGKACLDFVFEEDREKTAWYLKDHREGKGAVQFQNLFSCKDGSLVPISWATRWVEQDGLLYCVVRDITERKKLAVLQEQYKEDLQKQNEDMASILERITDGFYALDKNDNIIYWNKQAEWMLGKPRQEVLGRNLWELFPELINSPFYENYQQAFQQQAPVYFEGYYAPRDIWTETSVYPSAYGLSIFFRNCNERKRLERQLREQQRQLTAAVIMAQEKERSLISGELHDNVNQLLTSAKLYASLGRDGIGDAGKMMERTVSLLQDAIDEIRRLSKRLADPSFNDVDLEELIRELVQQISETYQIPITLDIDNVKTKRACADVKLAVYRILQEHLTNILKHAEASLVDVVLHKVDEHLSLTVTDNGRGFDPQQRSSGIGLSSMRSRAESLMGSFSLTSKPGKGCTLFVQIPLKKPSGAIG